MKKYLFLVLQILLLCNHKVEAQNKVCTSMNPYIVTPKHWNGSRADNSSEQAIVLFDNNLRGVGQAVTTVATYAQVGTTWGIAFRHTDKKLYASALLKRHADISPDGLGAIYEINMANPSSPGTPSLWLDINASSFVDASNNPVNIGFPADPGIASRELAFKGTPGHDVWAYDKVGRQGIGDIEFSENLTQLYVMDLTNRQMLIIDYATKKLVTKVAVPDPGCNQANDRRPWGIKSYNGNVYIGVVCSGETNKSTSDVNLFIMKLDNIAAPTTFVPIINTGGVPAKDYAGWKYWSNNPNDINSNVDSWVSPLVSDIEFDADGNMVLGVMDRSGHQNGSHNYPPDPGETYTYVWYAYGDVLKASLKGATWAFDPGYQSFYNLVSGSSTPADDQFAGGLQVNNCTGTELMIANTIDPINVESNGTSWNNTSDGQKQTGSASTSSLEHHPYDWDFGVNLPFGKANGLGDLEVLMTFNCPTISSPSVAQTVCTGTNGSDITVQTSQNANSSIKFVKFTTDQSATNGSETAAELASIYAGTTLGSPVTPTGGANPYIATYTWNPADFTNTTNAPITCYVYAIMNPDGGASCRPVQEIQIIVNPKPSIPSTNAALIGTCSGATPNDDAKIDFTGILNADKADKSEGATYTGAPYTAATGSIAGGAVSFTGLKHNTAYTFRFYNAADGCFKDITITTPDITCAPTCNLVATATGTNPKCSLGTDGAVSLPVTGAVGTPTYLWSNGATTQHLSAVGAGTYSVTVTEGTCMTTASVTLTEPTAIVLICTKTDATTVGGSEGTATVVASGGTSPYTYAWSNTQTTVGISGLPKGTYTVTVTDANACTSTCSSVVSEPSAPICDLVDAGLSTYIDRKGTASTADDEYVISANPTGTGLAATYNVTGDITKTGVAYGSVVEIGRVPISTVAVNVILTDAGTSTCSVADGAYNLNGNSCLLLANPTVLCDDNGTPTIATDDTYSITINPTGNGLTGNYNVTGDLTVSGLAYGSAQQIGTGLAISAGGKTISVIDAIKVDCKLLNINIAPPATCSSAVPCPPKVCTPVKITKL